MNIFKRLLLLPMLLLMAIGVNAQSFGNFASAVFLQKNGVFSIFNVTGSGANTIGPGGPSFTGNLGTFAQNSGTLILKGAETKTYKDANGNVCTSEFFYNVHPQGSTGSFINMNLPIKATCVNGVFSDGLGPCTGNDQKWNTESANIDLTNKCPGVYAVDVYYKTHGSASSSTGCGDDANIGSAATPAGTMTYTITGTPITATATATSVCQGATSNITSTVSGGSAPYTYSWTGPNGFTSTAANPTTMAAGIYNLTVTDACGTTKTATTTVTIKPQPNAPSVVAGATACPAGTAMLTATGCSGTVTWSNGMTGSSITAPVGSYTATCTVDGCTSTASSSATVTACPPATPCPPPAVTVSPTSCPGGTATLTATGCNGTVNWCNGMTGSTITVGPGNYAATCTSNGCTSNPTIVTVAPCPPPTNCPAPPQIIASPTSCPSGTATLTATGCNGTVIWSNGMTGSTITVPAGTYVATCTVNGITSAPSAPVTIQPCTTAPSCSSPTLAKGPTSCPSNMVTLVASGCSGTVTWSNGMTGASIVVPAGTYSATCTTNGCTSLPSLPITAPSCPTITVTMPPTVTAGPINCTSGLATLTASGCNGTVTWSNGMTGSSIMVPSGYYAATCTSNGVTSAPSTPAYVAPCPPPPSTPCVPPTLTAAPTSCPAGTAILTASGCNGTVTWSNGMTGASITVPPGVYSATCSTNGCTSAPAIPVSVLPCPVTPPPPVNCPPPTVTAGAIACPTGFAILTASGCSGTVTWSNGMTGSSVSVPAGSYSATCTFNGCTSAPSAPVTVSPCPSPCPPFTVNVPPTAEMCADWPWTLAASVTGGSTPMTYSWTGPNGFTSNTLNPVILTPGTYVLTVKDNCGNLKTGVTVVIAKPTPAPPTLLVAATSCPAGTATLTASGCSGLVTWSTGAIGNTITVPAGSYAATCTVNGCSSPPSASITAPPCPVIQPCPPPFPPPPPPPPPCPASRNLVKNGSFEGVAATTTTNIAYTQPNWFNEDVTSSGKIETWKSGASSVNAVGGKQLIELNWWQLGTIVQTVNVKKGVPLNLSYYHRARFSTKLEKIRVDILDASNNTLIQTYASDGNTTWKKFKTVFVPTSDSVKLRFASLNSSNGDQALGNLLDSVTLNYSQCECTFVPDPPVICATKTNLCSGGSSTITATGCPGGTIKWNNGTTGPTLTTSVPGTYYAQCTMPNNPCESVPSNPVVITSCVDVQVSCPKFQWMTNGIFHISYCVKNVGSTVASGTVYLKLNGTQVYSDNYSNLAPGSSQCYTYAARSIPCGSTVIAEVGSTVVGTDTYPGDNSCTCSQSMSCVPNPPPYDPNYKTAMPKRSLEGGIFPSDEWLTYTVHCQNDGLGVAHNVVMLDSIDITKFDINSIEVLSSQDPVAFNKVSDNVVAFSFYDVNLASSHNDLPTSQTEVVFKIKRLPGQAVGTELLNKVGIYFDHEAVVETQYAVSKIIEACDSSKLHTGVVSSDQFVPRGHIPSDAFNLNNYEGIITGWQVSPDPTFNDYTQTFKNYTATFSLPSAIDKVMYVRALVQTGGCAIAPSVKATVYPICGNMVQNGSFENPALTEAWAIKSVPNWTNLADDNKIEIQKNHLTTATEGAQYAELNGYNYGTIYQDINVIPGKTIIWKLDHKARTTGIEIITVTISAPNGSNAKTFIHKASPAEWQTIGGTYSIATGQVAVRIKVASSTSSAGAAMGNFIDDVVIDYVECNNPATRKAEILPAINNSAVIATINITPNPVLSSAKVDLKGYDDGDVTVNILDASGRVLKNIQYNYTTGNKYDLDLSGLSQGLYLIRVEQNGKSATAKVIKN